MGPNNKVKSLIINGFNFKKPTIWVILIAITVITSTAVLNRIDVPNVDTSIKNITVADNLGCNKEMYLNFIDDTYVMDNEIRFNPVSLEYCPLF